MGILEFVSSIVASLAWPVSALAVVLIFGRQIKVLLPLLRKLKYKEIELEFAEQLEQAEVDADAAKLPTIPAASITLEGTAREAQPKNALPARKILLELAAISPTAAIGEAWKRLDNELRLVLAEHGINVPPQANEVIRLAAKHGVLSSESAAIADRLRLLRNNAVHNIGDSIPLHSAIEYIDLVERVLNSLKQQ